MYTEKTIAAACIYLAITGYNCIPLKDALPVLLTGSGADQTSFMNCVHTLKALYSDFDHLFHLCVCFSDLWVSIISFPSSCQDNHIPFSEQRQSLHYFQQTQQHKQS